MPYITPPELAERPGARELAQLAGPEFKAPVDPALMDASLRGADRGDWPAEQRDVADAALARIQDAVAEADAIIDGFLVQRGYTLPMAPPPSGSVKSMLTAWSRSITRYLLHKGRVTDADKDPIARDYRDALRMLQLMAEGKFSLGANDPSQTGAEGGFNPDVRFSSNPATFGRGQLNAFR
jgi:phage gp36-like protein